MKIKELKDRLTGKLRLEANEASRHVDYRLRCQGKVISLPALLRVTRATGELPNRNLGGIAGGLGLNEHSLKEMVGCRISRACVLLCLSAKLLEFARQHLQEQGEVFRPGIVAMADSVKLLLAEPDLAGPTEWTAGERKALDRALSTAAGLTEDKDIGPVVAQLIEAISR